VPAGSATATSTKRPLQVKGEGEVVKLGNTAAKAAEVAMPKLKDRPVKKVKVGHEAQAHLGPLAASKPKASKAPVMLNDLKPDPIGSPEIWCQVSYH
jgi:hypothetical protein